MSRGTRFLTLAIPLIAIYLLALIGLLPVPFLSEETVNQILPVVSLPPFSRYLSHVTDWIDPILATRFFRRLFTYFPRIGITAVQ
jgi:hypothetical protein